MNELSLFTGAGGGVLGSLLLGHRVIGYVEWDEYCQKVIAQRIKDGILPEAPIFGDVRAFVGEGYAASYTGLVDVLTAGFPCQPFSVAGKQQGADDERNMWPATADVIRIVRPRYILLENVPGVRGYLPMVFRDLRRLGYTVRRPLILGADDAGAPHRRKRVWIYAANTSSKHWQLQQIISSGCENTPIVENDGKKEDVADAGLFGSSPNENRQTKPTPSQQAGKHGMNLATAVQENFPTPTAQDAKNNGAPSQMERNTKPLNAAVGGPLNPTWVEWLMGWPLGWTDLKPLAMDRFREWWQHGGF